MQFSNLQAVEKTERQFEILRLCHGAMLTMLKTNNTKARTRGQSQNGKPSLSAFSIFGYWYGL